MSNPLSKNIDTNIKVICTMKVSLSSFIHDEFHFNYCRTYSQLWGANVRWHNGKTINHRANGRKSIYLRVADARIDLQRSVHKRNAQPMLMQIFEFLFSNIP